MAPMQKNKEQLLTPDGVEQPAVRVGPERPTIISAFVQCVEVLQRLDETECLRAVQAICIILNMDATGLRYVERAELDGIDHETVLRSVRVR